MNAADRQLAHAAQVTAALLDGVATDPRKLKPGELCRLLNSTPLGAVLTDRRLRGHRISAGMRIGEGKTIDLFRYAAWLAGERRRQLPVSEPADFAPLDFADPYEAKKERERARNAEQSRKGRDIGPIPEVADPVRRALALRDPELFAKTYFPLRFTLGMSSDQRKSLAELNRIIHHGGKKAFSAPRGDGKTTRAEVMAIYALLTGKRRFVAVVGATAAAAKQVLKSIKGEFETNELLAADFPEVCFPIWELEGIHNRCKGQLSCGKPTWMVWSGDMLVFPTIAGSPASGAVLCVRGILGQIRGMKHRRTSGETVRPDLVIVDDPQTKRSARSAQQCKQRLEIITGDVLGLAGPGKTIACFIPCTVIERNDLADQLLDTDQHGAFQGVRTRLVHTWPKNEKLWDEYADLRRAGLKLDDLSKANAFYKRHRKAMDAGAVVAWSERFDREAGELSAIQNAMNLRFDHPETFDAEYQNEPRDESSEEERLMTAAEISAKLSGLPRLTIPLACTKVTAFIDVQQRLLYYAICAWTPEFTGTCIEYGTWPDQERKFFIYRDAPKPIQSIPKFRTAGVEGAIRGALDALIAELTAREYAREDGAAHRIERIFVDSGDWSEVVYQCCRESQHAAVLLPTKGKGITADKARISEWRRKEGQIIGEEWMLGKVENRRAVRLLTFDTNYWKTKMHAGLATAAGDRGCFTLYGQRGSKAPGHDMIGAHLAAETRKKTEGGGRTVFVYTLRPEKPDNHLLDCVAGNFVAASERGCRLIGKPQTEKPKPPPPRTRVSYLN